MADIRWFGHNCFRIRTREAAVIMDPLSRPTGYTMQKQIADIVTISHGHEGHANLAVVKPTFHLINGPGEYEMDNVFITGIRTWHDDARGAEKGFNTAFLIDAEGMRICHLGDLGHVLTAAQTEELQGSDILMIPAGGGEVLSPIMAAEVVAALEPKIVIPMQFATTSGDRNLGSVDDFCKALGMSIPAAEEKLTIKSSELPEAMQVIVLKPYSESS